MDKEGSRVNDGSCKGRSSENKNMCSSSGGAQEKGKDKMKLSLHTKIGGKTSLDPSYFVLYLGSFPQ
jgi:hypothetical protein